MMMPRNSPENVTALKVVIRPHPHAATYVNIGPANSFPRYGLLTIKGLLMKAFLISNKSFSLFRATVWLIAGHLCVHTTQGLSGGNWEAESMVNS
jgi:hypothetical protein